MLPLSYHASGVTFLIFGFAAAQSPSVEWLSTPYLVYKYMTSYPVSLQDYGFVLLSGFMVKHCDVHRLAWCLVLLVTL